MRFLESTCITGTHEMRQAVVTAQLMRTTKTLNVKNFRVRIPYPLQWDGPTFDAGDVFGVSYPLVNVGVPIFLCR
jgi:hypothetical protein